MTIHKVINIGGRLVSLDQPKIMGIINVTPDSFYSGSRSSEEKVILTKAEKMLKDGATFLDIGGYSSRPGATDISEEEEIARVIKPAELLGREFPEAYLSIDTFRSNVARLAVESGAHIVNDISGGELDPRMFSTVGRLGVPYIAMHMRGTPQMMRQQAVYDDLMKEVTYYFSKKVAQARAAGIKDLIIDPGFGFAKSLEQNYYLLKHVDYLKYLDQPLLIGLSRKSMIFKVLNVEANGALNGTTVLNTVALLKGASILRVHDVKEANEAVSLLKMLSIDFRL